MSLRVVKPVNGEAVDLNSRVWGETPYPGWKHYILVKPLNYNCEGKVSAQMRVEGNVWDGSAQFGDRNTGSGTRLEVFVLATRTEVPRGDLCRSPPGSKISTPVTVIRK